MSTRFQLKGKNKDSYLELVLEFPLASIKTERHLAEAQRVLDELLAHSSKNDGEEMYLDALSDLIAAYEDEHHALPHASDAELLQHLMEAKGVSQVELSRATKLPKSTISEILAGKKSFSRKVMHVLAAYFQIDVGVLAVNI